MAQSTVTIDKQVFQGTAAISGGTFVATITTSAAPFTDQVIRLRARIFLSAATSGHTTSGCGLLAEVVLKNNNNTVTALTAITGSTNPDNSGGLVSAGAEAADATMNTSTANWTVASNNATLTVTNNGTGSVAANVTVIVDIEMVGST